LISFKEVVPEPIERGEASECFSELVMSESECMFDGIANFMEFARGIIMIRSLKNKLKFQIGVYKTFLEK
jgi:hypothetical protein